MSGMHDGVNKVWTLRWQSGLVVEGHASERELAGHLLRRAGIDWSNPEAQIAWVEKVCQEAVQALREEIAEEARIAAREDEGADDDA